MKTLNTTRKIILCNDIYVHQSVKRSFTGWVQNIVVLKCPDFHHSHMRLKFDVHLDVAYKRAKLKRHKVPCGRISPSIDLLYYSRNPQVRGCRLSPTTLAAFVSGPRATKPFTGRIKRYIQI